MKITRESLINGEMRAHLHQHLHDHPEQHWRSQAEMDRLLDETLAKHDPAADLWVFGYGSLIWNPAIEFTEKRCATLRGWHRRFCLKMYVSRGSPEHPALMLALDHGGTCRGVAFRIEASLVRHELGLLWQREMYGGSYNAAWVTLEADGARFRAVTFIANRAHPRYVRDIPVAQTAAIIATARGDLGSAREYFENTMAHLKQLGVVDAGLVRIARALPKP